MKKYSPFHNPLRVVNSSNYRATRRSRAVLSSLLGPEVLWRWYAPVPETRARGRVDLFSDSTIWSLLAVKLAFGLSFSGVLGLVGDHMRLRRVKVPLPSEATLSRRGMELGALVERATGGVWVMPEALNNKDVSRGVVIDSTGISIRGAGAWRTCRPHGREEGIGTRRRWRKPHLCVDPESGVALAAAVTDSSAGDGATGIEMLAALRAAGVQVHTVAADGAYDTQYFYRAAVTTGATQVLVPPRKGASVWDDDLPGADIRNTHWSHIHHTDPEETAERKKLWKEDIGYHIRSLIETAMSRLARATGNRCRMRSPEGQTAEIHSMVQLLNRHASTGMPERFKRAWSPTWCASIPCAA